MRRWCMKVSWAATINLGVSASAMPINNTKWIASIVPYDFSPQTNVCFQFQMMDFVLLTTKNGIHFSVKIIFNQYSKSILIQNMASSKS